MQHSVGALKAIWDDNFGVLGCTLLCSTFGFAREQHFEFSYEDHEHVDTPA